MDPDALIFAVAIPAGVLGILHLLPWPRLIGDELPRLVAYAIGVGTIAGITTWLGVTKAVTPEDVIRLLWLAVAAGGGMTLALWGLRALLRLAGKAMLWDAHASEKRQPVRPSDVQ